MKTLREFHKNLGRMLESADLAIDNAERWHKLYQREQDFSQQSAMELGKAREELESAQSERDAALKKHEGAKAALVRELLRNQKLERDLGEVRAECDTLRITVEELRATLHASPPDSSQESGSSPTGCWFPVSTPPSRPGVFEVSVQYPNNVLGTKRYSLWDGEQWNETCDSPDKAVTSSIRSIELYMYPATWKGPRL